MTGRLLLLTISIKLFLLPPAAFGQTVYHLHVHVIPRWEGVPLGRHGAGMADMGELRVLADQIAAKL